MIPDDLFRYIEQLVKRRPDNFILWSRLAQAREETGDLRGAKAAYQMVLSLDPQRQQGYLAVARVSKKLGQAAEAQKLRYKSYLLTSGWPNHLHVGDYCYRNGDYALAAQHYKAAVQSGGSGCYVLNYLAAALVKQGKLQEAIGAWESSLKISGANPKNLYNIGWGYGKLGSWTTAEHYLNVALRTNEHCKAQFKLSPEALRHVHCLLAWVYTRQGKPFQSAYQSMLSRPGSQRTVTRIALALFIVLFIGLVIVVVIVKRSLAAEARRPSPQ